MSEASSQTLVEKYCPNCGILYAVTGQLDKQRRRDGKITWCPNGHASAYEDSDAEKIRKANSDAEHWQAEAERLLSVVDTLRDATALRNRAFVWWAKLRKWRRLADWGAR